MNSLLNVRQNYARPFKLVVLVAMLIGLTQIAACKMTASVVTEADCEVFQPVRWSKKDTLRTVEQVREHNAVWKSLCGGSSQHEK